jgi:hypothetical protein
MKNKNRFLKIIRERKLSKFRRELFVQSLNNLCAARSFGKKIRQRSIERVLRLPMYSLRQYSFTHSSPPAELIAVIKIVETFPMLLKVAQFNYDEKIINDIMWTVLKTADRKIKITRGIDDQLC